MTQKDYILIARVINNVLDDGNHHDPDWYLAADSIAIGLAYYLKEDNVRFDRRRFLDACGVKE